MYEVAEAQPDHGWYPQALGFDAVKALSGYQVAETECTPDKPALGQRGGVEERVVQSDILRWERTYVCSCYQKMRCACARLP